MSLAALNSPAGRLTAGFYAALFSVMGAHLPFWPLWLSDWGLEQAEIGAYLGLAVLARVAAGVAAPWFADVTGRRRTALVLLALFGMAAFLAHLLAQTRPALLALTLLASVTMSGAVPIGDALAGAAARLHGFAYAQVRAAGSAAFLLANLGCGWAGARWGSGAALWWIVLSLAALAWFSSRHPGGVRNDAPRPGPGAAMQLVRTRPFALAALASATLQAAHGPVYAYGSLHWRSLGIGEGAIGGLWAIGVAAEVVLMFAIGGWMTARLGAWGLFALSGVVGVVRWAIMAGEPGIVMLWAMQLAHALTFAPAHLAMIAFVSAAAPAGMAASAQGLIGAGAGGAAMAAAMLGAAALYPALGAGVFLIGVALSLTGLLAALALRRAWGGGEVGVRSSPADAA